MESTLSVCGSAPRSATDWRASAVVDRGADRRVGRHCRFRQSAAKRLRGCHRLHSGRPLKVRRVCCKAAPRVPPRAKEGAGCSLPMLQGTSRLALPRSFPLLFFALPQENEARFPTLNLVFREGAHPVDGLMLPDQANTVLPQ